MLLLILGQGPEKGIDWQTQAVRRHALKQMENSMKDGHILIGRDHIDAVGANQGAVLNLENLHRGGSPEQFRHGTLLRWLQVLNDDKGGSALCWDVPQQKIERLQTSGRGTNTDDRENGAGPRASFGGVD